VSLWYHFKSALRDVTRALGLEAGQIDRLSRSMYWWDKGKVIPEHLRKCEFDPWSYAYIYDYINKRFCAPFVASCWNVILQIVERNEMQVGTNCLSR